MTSEKSYSDFIDLVEDFDNLSQIEQVKYVSYFYTVLTGKEEFTSTIIGDVFTKEKLYRPPNVTDCLNKLANRRPLILLKKGNLYSFQRTQKRAFDDIYLSKKHVREISETMRGLLSKVNSIAQKSFLEEAISCFEIKCYRSSIVMTWLLTMDTLYEFTLNNSLNAFNSAIQSHGKYKKIVVTKKDDFADIKESDFIELLRVAKIISNDVRKILDEKLNFRNTAAHPNTIVIKESKAISFIEDLTENILIKFQ